MPKYFFDIDDGRRRAHDEWGMELPDFEMAKKEAVSLLRTLAEVRHMEKRPGATLVRVRNDSGEAIYEGLTHVED